VRLEPHHTRGERGPVGTPRLRIVPDIGPGIASRSSGLVADTVPVRQPGSGVYLRAARNPTRPGVRVACRVVPELVLKTCWGKKVVLPRDLDLPTVVGVYPGADWSPDGGSESRIADAEQHRAFERQVMGLYARQVRVVGLSSECAQAQCMSVLENRLHRLEELWGDPDLVLARTLGLPTFTNTGTAYYRRATLFFDRGHLEKVFYPVESPHRSAEQIVSWLEATGR
jgi:peroxiredoxin